MSYSLNISPSAEVAVSYSNPYITYNCKTTVNLNFLFREIAVNNDKFNGVSGPADGSDQVVIIPSYQNNSTAETFTNSQRSTDNVTVLGKYIAMRFINSILGPDLKKDSINSQIQTNLFYFGGYSNGLVSGVSVNVNNATATMDFGEFFQVSLSTIRAKGINANTTLINGLCHRELINSNAVSADLMLRNFTDFEISTLIRNMLKGSEKSGTFADGIADDSSTFNWMKLLIWRVVNDTGGTAQNERFVNIVLTNPEIEVSYPDYSVLNLITGDTLTLNFILTLSDASGNEFNIDRPDQPGIPITIGYKITHSDTASDYNSSDTGSGNTLSVGWELSV
jgi:hypothetical protein